MNMININVDDLINMSKNLKSGDRITLSGVVYTARDAAHTRFFELLDSGDTLPFNLNGAVIYYTGPTPAQKGMAVGSCGPTTSSRMDKFTPRLLDLGLRAIIGKGERNEEVSAAIRRNGAVYFCAVGGAGALIASHVVTSEEIAFSDLGCESVKKLLVEKLPLTVAIDCLGGNIFNDEKTKYAKPLSFR